MDRVSNTMRARCLWLVAPIIWSLGLVSSAWAGPSIARTWDEAILAGIRVDKPNPPVHARNLFHLSVAMYDAWAAYDTNAVGYLFHEKHPAADVASARNEAISYAAYRLLRERYAYSVSATNTLAALDALMASLGYDTNNVSTNASVPAGVGNSVYAAVSAYFLNDGAYQTNSYKDKPPLLGGYAPVNPPLITGLPGDTNILYLNHWQPLAITNSADQHGFPDGLIQIFLGSQWLGVRPFALQRTNAAQPWIDPGPQPHFPGKGSERFTNDVIDVLQRSGQMTPDDGVTLDISPGAWGNNTLGTNDGSGRSVNPATGRPYAANVVPRGDFGRVIAEYWADGPNSETPPGHWNVLANQVADALTQMNLGKRIAGTGPVVDDLEWDVKVYFALNAAVHDAACAAWSLKRVYDGGRPISYIRFTGQSGQCTDRTQPSYSPNGLPLATNCIELVTTNTAAPGGRHAGFTPGQVVIYAWPGPPADPTNQHSGVKWMVSDNWLPYQKRTFVTPAFPGYISGHSTFSRAAAEVLAAITCSPFFPGGLGTFTAPSNTFLKFESGPSQTVQLQWATYFDASDQAGISRLYGGIHVSADDLTGRIIGAQCGRGCWALAKTYFDGSVLNTPVTLTLIRLPSGAAQLRYNVLRGLFYHLQSTPGISQPFVNDPSGSIQAVDSFIAVTTTLAGPQGFYRVMTAVAP